MWSTGIGVMLTGSHAEGGGRSGLRVSFTRWVVGCGSCMPVVDGGSWVLVGDGLWVVGDEGCEMWVGPAA